MAVKVQRGFDRFNLKPTINQSYQQKRNAMAKEVLEHKTFDPSELNHKDQMSDPTPAR